MTREQIEKAAIKFAKSHYLDKYGNMNAEITEDEFDALVCSIAYMFMYGAQWRINSVWHKPSAYGEELTRDVEVIAKTKRGYRFGKFGVVGYSNEYVGFVSTSSLEYALSDVLEYAYLDDLLPERKEGAE